jgi:hypothetical protein
MAGRYAVDDGKPLPPVGTRGAGKHQSAVLLQAREAIDAGRYASEHEAAEAFYEEYSGRRETTKKMRAKLRRMAPKEVKEGA